MKSSVVQQELGSQTSDGHNHQSGSIHDNSCVESVAAKSLGVVRRGPENVLNHKRPDSFFGQMIILSSATFTRQCHPKSGVT